MRTSAVRARSSTVNATFKQQVWVGPTLPASIYLMTIEIASVALDASPSDRYRGLIEDDLWVDFGARHECSRGRSVRPGRLEHQLDHPGRRCRGAARRPAALPEGR